MEALPVTLIVKAPNQQFEDQTVKCELSWSIRKLKGYLSEVYPCNPSLEEQKLIYSGQLLNDAHILKDILRQYEGQETHTVHLVFTPKNKTYYNSAQKKEMKPTPQRTATSDGTRQRNSSINTTQETTPSNAMSTSRYAAESIQSHSSYNSEQFAIAQQLAMHNMMHQMYLQYLNHYARTSQSHALNDSSSSVGAHYPPPNFENELFAQTITPQQPAIHQNRNVYEPAGQPQAQNQPQGQLLQNDDEAENRDWLDILYTFSRLIVLLSLVYFYSSPGRCSIVILVMVLYYFYQNHQRNIRDRLVLENQQAAAIAIATPNDLIDDNAQAGNVQTEEILMNPSDTTRDAANEILDESESSTTTAQHEDNNRFPTIELLRTFVLSFFASLIPETPAV